MTIDNVLEILEKHKLRIPSNVFYELKADIVNFEEPTTKNDLEVDCIDRQATLDAIIKRLGISNESYLLPAEKTIYQQIKDMPSVTPQEPRKGHWIDINYHHYYNDGDIETTELRCSCCNEEVEWDIELLHKPYYCENCGAKMVEPQESEDKE